MNVIETTTLAIDRMLLWMECYEFLSGEAECLDDDRLGDWLQLLTPDIRYEIPIRLTKHRGEDPFSREGWHMKEDFSSLHTRVGRLGTTSAWAEDPPSRTRRLIGTVRCTPSEREDEIDVKSNLLLFRSRGDTTDHVLLAAERRDVLRRTDDGLRLAARTVLLSHTILPVQSLSIFL
jgi:3-phenylpropionate/cinnamic acid dioxygenase small subunit